MSTYLFIHMKQLGPHWKDFCECLYETFILTRVKKSYVYLVMARYNRHFTVGLTYIYVGSLCNGESVMCEVQPEAEERFDDL